MAWQDTLPLDPPTDDPVTCPKSIRWRTADKGTRKESTMVETKHIATMLHKLRNLWHSSMEAPLSLLKACRMSLVTV